LVRIKGGFASICRRSSYLVAWIRFLGEGGTAWIWIWEISVEIEEHVVCLLDELVQGEAGTTGFVADQCKGAMDEKSLLRGSTGTAVCLGRAPAPTPSLLWLGERSTVGGVRERRDGRGKNRVGH
jgi:hypothetical protein